jgi:hypothetical protein
MQLKMKLMLTHTNTMDTFQPHKPEVYFAVRITAREAHLLQKLRKYSFGTFTVHKANNLLIRLEINESQIIDEEGEIDLT